MFSAITKLGLIFTGIFAAMLLWRALSALQSGLRRYDVLSQEAEYQVAQQQNSELPDAISDTSQNASRRSPETQRSSENTESAAAPGPVETTLDEPLEQALLNVRYPGTLKSLRIAEQRRRSARNAAPVRPAIAADSAVASAVDDGGRSVTYRLEDGQWQHSAKLGAAPEQSDPLRTRGLKPAATPPRHRSPEDSNIPPGYRSIEIQVPLRGDILEFTKPRKRVDVIWIHGDEQGRRSAETILKQVRVSGIGVLPGASTNSVSLLLAGADAQKVERAKSDGKLELVLTQCKKDCTAVPPPLPAAEAARTVEENRSLNTLEAGPAAFELSFSTQSFTEALSALAMERTPDPETIRLEELINAAASADPSSESALTFSITAEAVPVNHEDLLLSLTVKARDSGDRIVALNPFLAVEFNPAVVAEYRLIGYDYRPISEWEINEAAPINSRAAAVVMFRVRLTGRNQEELAFVKLIFEDPDGGMMKLISAPLAIDVMRSQFSDSSYGFKLALAGTCSGQVLRQSRMRIACPPELIELIRNDAAFASSTNSGALARLLESTRLKQTLADKSAAPAEPP